MTRWTPPKPKTPQIELRLEQRGRFTLPLKLQPSTAIESAEATGIKLSGDRLQPVGNFLPSASLGGTGFQPVSALASTTLGVLGVRITTDTSESKFMSLPPNNPAAGKAGISRLLAVEHHCPGLPEPGRYA